MKQTITTIALFACALVSQAQEQAQHSTDAINRISNRHEFTIHAGGGISTLNYNIVVGNTTLGMGGALGAGYTYYLTPQWGIATGIDFAFYNASLTAKDLHVEYLTATPTGLQGDFFFRADYQNLEEKQRVVMLQIPLMAQFLHPFGNKSFYAAAGFKAGIPLSAKYSQSTAAITTTGYSDYTNQTYENLPNHGFDTYKAVKPSGNLDMKISLMLSLESGVKWTLAGNTFYTGIYLDYGLNNIRKESTQKLVVYNPAAPNSYTYNSIVQSQADRVVPVAVGVKVKWSIKVKN